MKYRDFSTRLAADGDTWGIEGPTFLICYLVVAVLAIIVVLGIRHSATRGLFDSRSGRALDSEHIGYLAGFRSQAYFAALAALRALGLVDSVGPGMIAAAPYPQRIRLSGLQQAILQAAESGAKATAVKSDSRLTAPLDRIRDELGARGLLMTPERTSRCRRAAGILLVVEAVGVARVAAALQNGHPFLNLLAIMIVVGVLGLVLLAVVPARTAAGTAALRDLRNANTHLTTAQNPSWTTYGAVGVGLSVALFGTGSLFAMDPVFAGAADVPRYANSGGYAGAMGDGGGSGDGGGGSSCGGGGSSCGGGGCGG